MVSSGKEKTVTDLYKNYGLRNGGVTAWPYVVNVVLAACTEMSVRT